jgi:predicted secreted protein
MAAKVGREDSWTWGGDAIGGVRSKGLAVSGEPIDITSDDDAGWRKLDTISGQDSVNLTISGIDKDMRLFEDFFAGNRTKEVVFNFAKSGGTLTSEFYLTSLSRTGEYNGAVTYDAELQSSGEAVYAAAAAPINSIVPAIHGTPQVGVLLTASPGVWSGNPSFAYQWKKGGVNIAGATSRTYTPVTADVAGVLTVTVTATNTAGSASATSGPAAAVLAA